MVLTDILQALDVVSPGTSEHFEELGRMRTERGSLVMLAHDAKATVLREVDRITPYAVKLVMQPETTYR